jgi:hypothetical protein
MDRGLENVGCAFGLAEFPQTETNIGPVSRVVWLERASFGESGQGVVE